MYWYVANSQKKYNIIYIEAALGSMLVLVVFIHVMMAAFSSLWSF